MSATEVATSLASESWIDGWPFWLRLLTCLIGAPTLIIGALLFINGVAGYPAVDAGDEREAAA